MIIPVNTPAQCVMFQKSLFEAGYRWKNGISEPYLSFEDVPFPIVLECDLDALTFSWQGMPEPVVALNYVLDLTRVAKASFPAP